MGGSSLCTAGLLEVHVMWCLWSFLLEVGFWRAYLGDGGCDGISLVLLRLGVPLAISALGGDVLHPSCVLFWWAGCVWVVVAWLLWSASGGVPWMCDQCGACMCG